MNIIGKSGFFLEGPARPSRRGDEVEIPHTKIRGISRVSLCEFSRIRDETVNCPLVFNPGQADRGGPAGV